MRACFGFPGFGIGECTSNIGDWSPTQAFAIRVHKHYADLSYRVTENLGGILLYQVDNVSPEVATVHIPPNRQFAVYDEIFPDSDTKLTPGWESTTEWRVLLQAVNFVQTGGFYQHTRLVTMAWQVLLALDVSGARTTEENLLNVSMCGVVDQIQLSFHSFFVFSTFCGVILIICMCCLVGVTTARTPAIANSFVDIG